MNSKLREILQRVETWPESAQEEAVECLLALEAEYAEPVSFSDEDLAAFEQSAEDVRQGRFASEDEVEAVLRRYRGG
jgi:hypothetical protein